MKRIAARDLCAATGSPVISDPEQGLDPGAGKAVGSDGEDSAALGPLPLGMLLASFGRHPEAPQAFHHLPLVQPAVLSERAPADDRNLIREHLSDPTDDAELPVTEAVHATIPI